MMCTDTSKCSVADKRKWRGGGANGELMGETNMRPQNVLGTLTVGTTGIYNFREGAVHIHSVLSHTCTRMLSACH